MKISTFVCGFAILASLASASDAGLLDFLRGEDRDRGTEVAPVSYGRIVAVDELPPAPGVPDRAALMPTPEGPTHVLPAAGAFELYPHVRVEDRDNIHPCAVPVVVMVKDPCPRPVDPCSHCQPEPSYVYVQICVPPNCCPNIKCSRDGSKVKYDYGDYEVEIVSRRGVVYVDYDD